MSDQLSVPPTPSSTPADPTLVDKLDPLATKLSVQILSESLLSLQTTLNQHLTKENEIAQLVRLENEAIRLENERLRHLLLKRNQQERHLLKERSPIIRLAVAGVGALTVLMTGLSVSWSKAVGDRQYSYNFSGEMISSFVSSLGTFSSILYVTRKDGKAIKDEDGDGIPDEND